MKLTIKLTTAAPVKIISKEGVSSVDARDLHRHLGVKSKFADWIKNRINDYDFVEGEDFSIYTQSKEGNNAVSSEYSISFGMAKELGMVERSAKGKEIRKFFIECERAMSKVRPGFVVPKTFAEAMRLAADNQDKLDLQRDKITQDAPKVEFFETVVSMPDGCPISIACQVAGLKFGQNTLYKKLRDKGVLFRSGVRYNLPKQAYVSKGLFSLKETIYEHNRSTSIQFTTEVTQKGIAWLIKTYANRSVVKTK